MRSSVAAGRFGRFMTAREEIIQKVLAFPVEHITERYATDQNISLDAAREHERECKRFLGLCASNPAKAYGMRGPIDKYWHTFILFTMEYAKFCDTVAGRFLHHVPRSSLTPPADAKTSSRYAEMLNDYQQVFGEEPPAHLWPRVSSGGITGAGCEVACSCSSCVIPIPIPEPPDSCSGPIETDPDDDDD